jgi:adenosylhomocysteine nucleosidase
MTEPGAALVVMALASEAQDRFSSAPVLFTGVGKVNATYQLTRRLAEELARGRRPLVVNFGTAGSRRYRTGSLLACRRFVQRDMDVRELGFAAGQTPFEDVPAVLEFERVFEDLEEATCATADRFETLEHAASFDVLDMEAYALAKVCWLERLPFACVKYVSDGADSSSKTDWHTSLPLAAAAFARLYERMTVRG